MCFNEIHTSVPLWVNTEMKKYMLSLSFQSVKEAGYNFPLTCDGLRKPPAYQKVISTNCVSLA
jgi:hypothetical protein